MLYKLLEEQSQSRSELTSELFNAVYERPRLSMDEFVYSKKGLFLPKSSVYPAVMDCLIAIDDPSIREVFICAGKGGGKTSIVSILMARAADDLHRYRDLSAFFGLLPDSKPAIVNMSISKDHAKGVLFSRFAALLRNAPCFNPITGKLFDDSSKSSVKFPKKGFEALSGHSGYHAFIGYDTYFGTIDEMSHLRDTEDNPVTEEIYAGLKGSCLTRFTRHYKIVGISSPLAKDDGLFKRVMNTKEHGELVYVQGQGPLNSSNWKVVT